MNFNLLSNRQLKADKTNAATHFLQFVLQLEPAYKGTCGKAEQHQYCAETCIAKTGKNALNQSARIKRTELFLNKRHTFFNLLIADITIAEGAAKALAKQCLIRLNGTSDLLWEHFRHGGKTIFEHFPNVVFSDYTKWSLKTREKALVNLNYHLCFSVTKNRESEAREWLEAGHNVSFVYLAKNSKDKSIPCEFLGYSAVSGDEQDAFFLNKGAAIALRYKIAKTDDLTRRFDYIRQNDSNQLVYLHG